MNNLPHSGITLVLPYFLIISIRWNNFFEITKVQNMYSNSFLILIYVSTYWVWETRVKQFKLFLFNASHIKVTYHKIMSSNTSCLEAKCMLFQILMKGVFDPYVLWPFDKSWFPNYVVMRNYTPLWKHHRPLWPMVFS